MEIKILGGGHEVGRAAYAVRDGNRVVLLDYGINFDERDLPRLPMHIRPNEISALVITHAHLDHAGAAPYLYITGNIRAYSTRPTLDVARYLVLDFLKLNAPVIEYELRDFEKLYGNTNFLKYGEDDEGEGFKVEFYNAGHILGSAVVLLEMPSGKRVLYTGDINNIDTWTLRGADLPEGGVDVIIMESTYAARNHPPRARVESRLLEIIEETINRGGTVLIPAFSVGRGQEVMAAILSQAPYLDVYIDGMIKDITEVYAKHSSFLRDPSLFRKVVENVNFVTKPSERKKIINKPCVIIASAGMLKGGPSVYYLKKLHDNPRNSVILVSYQAPNSGGHRLLETGDVPEHDIKGVKARVEWLDLSSHAGKDGLREIALKYKESVKDIVLIHGSLEEASKLAEELRQDLGEDVRVHIPAVNDVINVE